MCTFAVLLLKAESLSVRKVTGVGLLSESVTSQKSEVADHGRMMQPAIISKHWTNDFIISQGWDWWQTSDEV